VSRELRRFSIGIAAVLACAAALSACAGLLGLDDIVYTAPDSSVDLISTGDGSSVEGPVVARCDAGADAYDLEGCACDKNGQARDCYRGLPGPRSACTQGTQTCLSGRWTGCSGARPDTEVCFDDIDNDCNGLVDEGCFCSDGVDLCMGDAGLFDPNDWRMFTVPPQPINGRPFDLYVVSTERFGRLRTPYLGSSVAPDGGQPSSVYCWADDASAPCPTVGAGCVALDAGWYAVRHHLTVNAVGSYLFYVYETPCSSAAKSFTAVTFVDAGAD
jgi:hypothetical protein